MKTKASKKAVAKIELPLTYMEIARKFTAEQNDCSEILAEFHRDLMQRLNDEYEILHDTKLSYNRFDERSLKSLAVYDVLCKEIVERSYMLGALVRTYTTLAQPRLYDDVVVVKGRKVPYGTIGRVGREHQNLYGLTVKLECANGDVFYTSQDNVEKLIPEDVLSKMNGRYEDVLSYV